MKLVIDIDEETYKAIVKPFIKIEGQRACKSVITKACISIAKGKPLESVLYEYSWEQHKQNVESSYKR